MPGPAGLASLFVGSTASMRRSSLARLGADAFALATSMVTAVLTAQALGPSGKGYYASLTLLTTLFVVGFELGIGDALIVLVGLGRARLSQAAGVTMAATIALAVGGTVAFAAVAVAFFGIPDGGEAIALALCAALVAVGVVYSTLVSFLLSEQRVALVAAMAVIGTAVTTVLMVVLAVLSRLDVQAALGAGLCGTVVATAATLHFVQAADIPVRPRIERGYLADAFRMGVGFQVTSLLIAAAARLDLLLVFKLGDAAAAGRYSVALTMGALVASIPTAVAHAAFPRVAAMTEEQAEVFLRRVLRLGMLGTVVSAAVLAVATPIVLPLTFGESFDPAVGPALILLAASVPWSGQWLLARSVSARGETGMLVASFGAAFVVMLALDIVLIPPHGESGAAVAALISSSVGFGVAGVMQGARAAARRRPHA